MLGLFLSIGSFAQSFTPSFEKEFLAQMFAQCPDSLKEDFLKMETSYSTYKFKEIRSIEQMKKFYQKKYKDNPEVIGYITDEVNAYVRHGDGESNLRVDFYYVDRQDTLNCFRINNDYGTLSKSFVTKSGKRYELRHAWGFLKLSEDGMTLLDCYCSRTSADNQGGAGTDDYSVYGNESFCWTTPVNQGRIPAFLSLSLTKCILSRSELCSGGIFYTYI